MPCNKNKTPENAWKLIEAFNNQETYEEAYKVLLFALKKSNLSAKEQDLLQYIPLKANYSSLTKESKTKFIDFIKNSIEAYPYEETFLDKLNILESIAEETKDEALKKWVALQTLRITNDMMTKKLSDDSFISKTDILFTRWLDKAVCHQQSQSVGWRVWFGEKRPLAHTPPMPNTNPRIKTISISSFHPLCRRGEAFGLDLTQTNQHPNKRLAHWFQIPNVLVSPEGEAAR